MGEKPLNILYLITKSNWGGAQRYVYDLATYAKNTGHDVLVGFGGNGLLAQKLSEAGVPIHSFDTLERDIRLTSDMRNFFRILTLLAQRRPDVIHINSSKMGGIGAVAGRVWNVYARSARLVGADVPPAVIIFTGHGWAFNEERSDAERFMIGILHMLTIHLTHLTITVSRRTRAQVITLPFVWRKLRVIHNGIGNFALLPKTDARELLNIPSGDTVLHVGIIAELHRNKGVAYAIEAIAQIKKKRPDLAIRLTVIGEGEERNTLERLIAEHGVGDSVRLVGYRDEGPRLLSAFDIFLLPSITEAFPYVILEAGRAGLPVVATAVGGVPEVVDDMESGILIQPKNSGEIVRALLYLYDNPERRLQLGKALALRIADRFSVDEMWGSTFALYRESGDLTPMSTTSTPGLPSSEAST